MEQDYDIEELRRMWKPGQVRRVDRPCLGGYGREICLQQEWVNALGEREWRDVPIETVEPVLMIREQVSQWPDKLNDG